MTRLVDAARRWAADALSRGALPAQVDLDELTDEDPPIDAVSAAIECGVALQNVVRASGHAIDVAIVIPIQGDEVELPTSSPTLGDLAELPWSYGPGLEVPGLYLVPPSVWGIVEMGEEYRRSLDDDAVPAGFVAYYRAWRSPEEAEKGWEFSRAIYIRTTTTSSA